MLHGGDNDSTGTIAGAWYGAFYGLNNVPSKNYLNIEDNKKIINYGIKLYEVYCEQKENSNWK